LSSYLKALKDSFTIMEIITHFSICSCLLLSSCSIYTRIQLVFRAQPYRIEPSNQSGEGNEMKELAKDLDEAISQIDSLTERGYMNPWNEGALRSQRSLLHAARCKLQKGDEAAARAILAYAPRAETIEG
jgi:hypothetical protein